MAEEQIGERVFGENIDGGEGQKTIRTENWLHMRAKKPVRPGLGKASIAICRVRLCFRPLCCRGG